MRLHDFNVNQVIAQGLPISAALGILALAFALTLGLAAGIVSAAYRGSLADLALMSLATIGIALPSFVIAGLAIMLFVFMIPIFPAAGWGTFQQLVLPAICLGALYAAEIARITRTGMLDALSQDYIRTARAKGLSESAVLLRHALPAALLPVVSFLGPAMAGILTGSVVVEKIFAIPGLGWHFVQAALQRDYTLDDGPRAALHAAAVHDEFPGRSVVPHSRSARGAELSYADAEMMADERRPRARGGGRAASRSARMPGDGCAATAWRCSRSRRWSRSACSRFSRRCCRCSRPTSDHDRLQYEPPQLSPLFEKTFDLDWPAIERTPAELRRVQSELAAAEQLASVAAPTPTIGRRRRRATSRPQAKRARRHRAAALSRGRLSRISGAEPLDGPHALPLVRRVVARLDRRPRRIRPRCAVARLLGCANFDRSSASWPRSCRSLIGVTYGAVAGYVGGWVDDVMMRFVDILYSIPFIFVVIFIITILSEEDIKARLARWGIDRITIFYFVVGAIYWLTMARVVRGQVISLRNEPFVEAARAIGARQIADHRAAHPAESAERRDRVSHAHDSARDAVRGVSVVSRPRRRAARCFLGPAWRTRASRSSRR